jgi:hypothetical protein
MHQALRRLYSYVSWITIRAAQSYLFAQIHRNLEVTGSINVKVPRWVCSSHGKMSVCNHARSGSRAIGVPPHLQLAQTWVVIFVRNAMNEK